MSETNINKTNAQQAPEWFEELGKPPHYVLPDALRLTSLTPAERSIALLLSQGFDAAEIASQRTVNRNTVSSQVQSIYSKWGVTCRSDFIKHAIAAGVVNLPEGKKLTSLIDCYRGLNPHERMIFAYVAKGLSEPKIASEIAIKENCSYSISSVCKDKGTLYAKLGIDSDGAGQSTEGDTYSSVATLYYVALKMEADRLYHQKQYQGDNDQQVAVLERELNLIDEERRKAKLVNDRQVQLLKEVVIPYPKTTGSGPESPDSEPSATVTISSAHYFPSADIASGNASFADRVNQSPRHRTHFR